MGLRTLLLLGLTATPAVAGPEGARLPRPGVARDTGGALLVAPSWQGPVARGIRAAWKARAEDPTRLLVLEHPRFGTVRIAKGTALSEALDGPEVVMRWLEANAAGLGLAAPRAELELFADERNDRLGQRYLRYRRVHRGLPTLDGELTVLLSAERRVIQVTGHYPPSFALDVRPAVAPADAVLRARRHAGHRAQRLWFAPEARLVVWVEGSAPRLAHQVTLAVARRGRLPYHAAVYVDALDGAILATKALIWTQQAPSAAMCTGQNWRGTNVNLRCSQEMGGQRFLADRATLANGARIDTMNFNNLTEQQGDPIAVQADGRGAIALTAAVNAAEAIATAYRYIKDVHGRPSWNHAGGMSDLGQLNTVNYARNEANAFATVVTIGGQRVSWASFGNGDGQSFVETSQCLDVAGHELFHNVIAATAGLVYENQSGALNEHIADAFGTALDKRYEDGDDLLGEDCTPGSRGIRDMSNPARFMQPAHMMNYENLPNTEEGDHGGVHVNSGILNKAFHSFYTARTVPTAETIWYRALTMGGLTARSQFADFGNALQTACQAIHAATPAICDDLRNALAGVGVTTTVPRGAGCPANASEMAGQCVCNAGFQPNAAGDACEAIPTASCPANSTQRGDQCYCNDGYVVNAQGNGCVPVRERPCPPNSTRVGDRCSCDDGYYGDPNAPEGRCRQQAGNCPLFSRYDGASCVCIDDFAPDMSNACAPTGTMGCTVETFVGRCVEGRYVVYCSDPDPAMGVTEAVDCMENNLVCRQDSAGFHDCAPAQDPCGNVGEAGTCAGNVLRYCDGEGAERGLFEVDCADYAARCEVEMGVADCYATAQPDAGAGGGGADAGTVSGGNTSPTTKKDGCGCRAGGTGGIGLGALLALGLRARRRR